MDDTLNFEKGKPDRQPVISEPDATVEDGQNNVNTDRKLEADGEAPYASHCRSDAQIWGLYLKETEMEDKEVTDLWNSSLDSLLVFAGLFAAILTAFLVESRKDLKEDPQEHLLKEIVNILRNNSAPSINQPFQPDSSSLQVNGLWFGSLTLTLISALGGVLAKGWLGKYNPASLRQHSSDACERELRATRARQWKLEPTITAIPLLIQVSLFLFFAGLIIQIVDEDIQIWSAVVILVGLTALLYIIATCLPWFSPACPFQTPLSGLFPGGTAQGRYRVNTAASNTPKGQFHSWAETFSSSFHTIRRFFEEVRRKPKHLALQAQILAWVITNSTNEQTIEEGIATVAGSKPTKELQDALSSAGAGGSLYQRLENCVKSTPGLPKMINNEPQLESLLHALLRIEQPLLVNGEPIDNLAPTSLLDEGQALRRWDDFQPYLQALVFSLRVHMLINRDRDDHDEMQTEVARSLSRMMGTGSPPYIRHILFFAALRGLLNGEAILRKMCGFILSKQILLADIREKLYSPRGLISGHVDCNDDLAAIAFHKEISEKLVKLCGDDDRRGVEAGVGIILKLVGYNEAKLRGIVGMAIPGIVKLVGNWDPDIRVRLSTELADYAEFHDAMVAAIPSVVELLKHDKYDVPSSAVSVLAKLADHAKFRDAMGTGFRSFIEFLKSRNDVPSYLHVSQLSTLAENPKFRDAMVVAIPSVVDLLKYDGYSVRSSAVSALGKLAENVECCDAIVAVFPSFIDMLQHDGHSAQSLTVHSFTQLADHAQLRDAIGATLPLLIELLGVHIVGSFAVSALAKLSDHAEFRDIIGAAIPSLTGLLKNEDYHVRSSAVSVLGKLAENAECRDAIVAVIPLLIELLKSESYGVSSSAIASLAEMAGHGKAEFYDAIGPAVPSVIELLKHDEYEVQYSAISAVGKLAENAEFHDAIVAAIPSIIELLKPKSEGYGAADPAAYALAKLADHTELCDAIVVAIPSIIELLRHDDYDVRSSAVSALGKLAEKAGFSDAIGAAIPLLIELLRHDKENIRSSATEAIAELSGNTEFIGAIMAAIPSLVKALKYDENGVGSSTLGKLAENAECRDAIAAAIPSFIEMLQRDERHALNSFVQLADYAELRDTIGGVIPSLIELLGVHSNGSFAVSALAELAGHAEFRDAIGTAIPSLIELLRHDNDYIRSSAVSTLATLAPHAKFRDAMGNAIPLLIELVKSKHYGVLYSSVSVLANLAEEAELREGMEAAIPLLVEQLEGRDYRAPSAAIFALSRSGKLRTEIMSSILCISLPSLPSLIHSPQGTFHPDLFQDSSAGYHRRTSSRRMTAYPLESLPLESDQLGIAQLWHHLSNKNSPRLQSGVESLSQMAETLQKFVQPVVETIGKLAKSALAEMSLVPLSDFAKHVNLRVAVGLLIPQLLKLNQESSTQVRSAAVSAFPMLAEHADLHDEIRTAIPSLIDLLKHDVWSTTASSLAKLAEHTKFRDVIGAAIPSLIELLKSKDYPAPYSAISVLTELAGNAVFCDAIGAAIPSLIELLRHVKYDIRSSAESTLTKLAENAEFRGAIGAAIPSLIELLKSVDRTIPSLIERFGIEDRAIPSSVISVLAKLAHYTEFRDAIRAAIPSLIELLMSEDYGAPDSAAYALAKLADHTELRDAIVVAIPSIIELLKHNEYNVRFSAESTLTKLAESAEFSDAIGAAIPLIVESLQSGVTHSAVSALSKLADHATFRDTIEAAILSLIEMIKSDKDDQDDVPSSAISALCKLAGNAEFSGTIGAAIPLLIELLKSEEYNVPYDAVSALAELAGNAEFSDEIGAAIPSIIELLRHDDYDVRSSAVSALGKLAENAEFSDAIGAAIMSIVELLKSEDNGVLSSATYTLAELSGHIEFSGAIGSAIPLIVELLKSTVNGVPSSAASALAKLADHTTFWNAIGPAIPSLIEMLKHDDHDARSSVVSALRKLAVNTEFREAIRAAIPSLIGLLKSKGYRDRDASSVVSLLAKLSDYTEFRDAIMVAIPSLIELLRHDGYSEYERQYYEYDRNPVRFPVASMLAQLAGNTEFQTALGAAVPLIIEQLKRRDSGPLIIEWFGRRDSDGPSSAVSVLAELAGNAVFRDVIEAAIPRLIEMLKSKDFVTDALTVVCIFVNHEPLRSSVTRCLTDILTLLKNNAPETRAGGASLIEALSKHSDALEAISQSSLQHTLVEQLHDSEPKVLRPLTNVFCVLVNQGNIHGGILEVVLHALNALNLPDSSVCGATILSVMASYAHFRDILYEIMPIHASLRHLMQDGSPQDADAILRRMEYFGVLKEL